jgi:membrane protein
MTAWLQRIVRHFTRIYTQRIWQVALDEDRSLRGHFYAVLRVISITLTGLD